MIVEAPAPGKEVECSLVGNADPVASPPGEIVTKSADWYDQVINATKPADVHLPKAVPLVIGK